MPLYSADDKIDYEDLAHARERLVDSYVIYNDEYVYIQDMDGNSVFILPFGRSSSKMVDIKDLITSNLPLGYYNKGKSCSYAFRNPVRNWRQGLRDRTCSETVFNYRSRLRFTSDLNGILKGAYPSIENCCEYIANEEKVYVAFSRTFAVGIQRPGSGMELFYKDKVVGKVSSENGSFSLTNKYTMLREALEECK